MGGRTGNTKGCIPSIVMMIIIITCEKDGRPFGYGRTRRQQSDVMKNKKKKGKKKNIQHGRWDKQTTAVSNWARGTTGKETRGNLHQRQNCSLDWWQEAGCRTVEEAHCERTMNTTGPVSIRSRGYPPRPGICVQRDVMSDSDKPTNGGRTEPSKPEPNL